MTNNQSVMISSHRVSTLLSFFHVVPPRPDVAPPDYRTPPATQTRLSSRFRSGGT